MRGFGSEAEAKEEFRSIVRKFDYPGVNGVTRVQETLMGLGLKGPFVARGIGAVRVPRSQGPPGVRIHSGGGGGQALKWITKKKNTMGET